MRLAIVGSRRFNNYGLLQSILDPYRDEITMIVSGGAIGADTLAQEYAKKRGIPILIHYPDYKKYGKGAPTRRNLDIVDDAESMIAFPMEGSVGTWHAIKAMKKLEKSIQVIDIESEDYDRGFKVGYDGGYKNGYTSALDEAERIYQAEKGAE